MTTKKATLWVLIWVGLAAIFNVGVYIFMGPAKALEFLGGYIIEQSLSLDNLFLFIVIFSSFKIPAIYQRRVLNYGIFGAIVLRLIFIVLGVAVVHKFEWILYVFGVILIFSGLKMMFKSENEKDIKDSVILKVLSKFVPISHELDGQKFFTIKKGIRYGTPLLAILVLIEGSDIIFAIDSIPAIFSITTDPFIVYTSNLFAIMGLRSLYFLIEKLHKAFEYVEYGVALILVFTGIKLSILYFHIEIPILASIFIIVGILAMSIVASLAARRRKIKKAYITKK
ncbi:MAG: TerC/Alx family metal homeostasis membrane protein [Hyphomonadaceae bacterium]|nr:TerC/Alx family metal homeostasis membrane protein [Clostridia bacterium]